jgi:two-component system, chemotaxis family, sensor kinase CheA
MTNKPQTIEARLNAIASQLPLLEKGDLSPFSEILAAFEEIAATAAVQPAFRTLIGRTIALVNNIIMGEAAFEAGCKKLGESLTKMMKAAKEMKPAGTPETGDGSNAPTTAADEEKDTTIPNDLRELVSKFANNQQAVLEDFEAYILELEKGAPQAKAAIKRIMHTWKGEFGVLDMQEYSRLVHVMEDRLEAGGLTGENLFRLKDFLAERMQRFAAGNCPAITDDERTALCGESGTKNHDENRLSRDVAPKGLIGITELNIERCCVSTNVIANETAEIKPPATPLSRPFTGDTSLLTDFINESRDHVHTAETLLLELETAPANMDAINSVFRSWHTIKGVAAFMALAEIQVLAHAMESVMDKARKSELQLNAACIDVLLEGNDTLKTFLGNVEESLTSGVLAIPPQYDALMQRLRTPLAKPVEGKKPDDGAGEKKIGEILVASGVAPAEAVSAAIEKQKQGDNRKLGEILIEEQKLPARAVGSALAAQTAARATNAIEETIRVPVNRIGQLVDSIGEAVIAHSMIYAHPAIAGLADQTVHTKIAHAAMIMRQIQEMAMSLRMVSVKATFQKMARLARDLSKKFDRDIDFQTEGEDTELDKSVVENIGDPLIHMIRNAIDHGVEPADVRAKAGKPATATVKLKAYHRAGNIYIELSDDGKGLDRTAIFEKAVSKNLCKAEARLTDEEIFRFIFLPGFSTAKVVTDVSGRGVGMDVVRRNIEALRGSCEIASTVGKGTTFTIRLPLTLAIVDGMIVRAGAENYIIPTLAIIESLRPSPGQVEKVMQRGAIVKVRSDLIPLVHLESLFSKNGNGKAPVDYMTGVVMIVEDMLGKKVGLHLDEIVGQQQVVIKSLGEGVGDVPGVTGGAIMNNGNVSLILDVGGIVKLAQG